MGVELRPSAFDPWRELARHGEKRRDIAGKFGANAVFVGAMRDFNEGDAVARMHLEHYPGMTEKCLQRIVDESTARWNLLDALVIHRVGEIHPGEPIVLVAVWSVHRGAAFDACREIMEALKSRAPFWKKEAVGQATRWVEKNTDGY